MTGWFDQRVAKELLKINGNGVSRKVVRVHKTHFVQRRAIFVYLLNTSPVLSNRTCND